MRTPMVHAGAWSPAELLEQGEVWHARSGDDLQVVKVAEMDKRHTAALMAWLLTNARQLHSLSSWELHRVAGMLQGEQAMLDLESDEEWMAEQDPVKWIRERPLFAALQRHLSQLDRS